MQINTKFSIGDSVIVLARGVVETAFVHAIEISVHRGGHIGTSGTHYKPKEPYVKYTLSDNKAYRERDRFFYKEENEVFKTKAELAKHLGLT